MSIVTRYRQVKCYAAKAGPCVVCGTKARRTKVFMNTVSPFNRNDDGTGRTTAEVQRHVRQLALDWESEPVMHAKCEAL